MQCLRCQNDAMPNNALCQQCFESATQRRQAQLSGWSSAENSSPPRPPGASEDAADAAQDPETLHRAPHLTRFLAYLCDSLIVYLVSQLIFLGLLSLADISVGQLTTVIAARQQDRWALLDSARTVLMMQTASALLTPLVYFVLFECGPWQATLGKRLMGLKVLSLLEERVSVDIALKRFALKSAPIWPSVLIPALLSPACGFVGLFLFLLGIVILLTCFVTIAEPICVLVTSNRQALHDMVARTQVVKVCDPGVIGILSTIAIVIVTAIISLML